MLRLVVLRELGEVEQLHVRLASYQRKFLTDLIEEQRPTWIVTWMTMEVLEVVEEEPDPGVV